jgi:hypothetical protein
MDWWLDSYRVQRLGQGRRSPCRQGLRLVSFSLGPNLLGGFQTRADGLIWVVLFRYWGDAFYMIMLKKDLVFDGVYEVAPHPVRSLWLPSASPASL